jgi:hypothetical protein
LFQLPSGIEQLSDLHNHSSKMVIQNLRRIETLMETVDERTGVGVQQMLDESTRCVSTCFDHYDMLSPKAILN